MAFYIALLAAAKLGELEHALSSKKEALNMLQAKANELGLRWDKPGNGGNRDGLFLSNSIRKT